MHMITIFLKIQLFNMPVELWTAEGLSYLASAVGEPLFADSATELKMRLSFARICVLIDASKLLVKEFGVNLPFQDPVASIGILKVRVSYQWVPPMCDLCKVFGHSRVSCKSPSVIVSSELGGNAKGRVWRVVGNKGKEVVVDEDQSLQAKEVLSPGALQSQSYLEVGCKIEALINPIEEKELLKGGDPVLSLVVDLQRS